MSKPQVIPYPFPLRPNFIATLSLPSDLTTDECERLSVFVKTLASESEGSDESPQYNWTPEAQSKFK